jgi:uroporphyrinogen-III synthase
VWNARLAPLLAPEPHAGDAPARTHVAARGLKPPAAPASCASRRRRGASPNTWREVLATLDALVLPPRGLIAVQEYGGPPTELLAGLAARNRRVLTVSVYRWELPDDTTALRHGLDEIVAGRADVAVFTSATQIEHAFRVAPDAAALRAAFGRVVVASVGPVCSEALEAHGVGVDLESDPPKMGPLVALIAERARTVASTKRRS